MNSEFSVSRTQTLSMGARVVSMTTAEMHTDSRGLGGRRGPKPKGLRAQIKVPRETFFEFERAAQQAEIHMSDLGAYYFMLGWNADRRDQGLPEAEIPPALRQAAEIARLAAEEQEVEPLQGRLVS